ncbi:SCO1/SenC [Rickettsiales bacterium Ac37b]|nr:SCO1/SenC [Rickettsiales bacterium Ac37b]
MHKPTTIVIVISIILIILSVSILMIYSSTRDKPNPSVNNIGGSFTLTDHNGKVFNSFAIKKKFKLIYFGFIRCPDVCPTALSTLVQLINALGDESINLQPIFITIDPERDNVESIKTYIEYFGEPLIGLTGTPAQIKQVASQYKVYYSKADLKSKHYMMNHSSFFYLTDKKDRYIAHFPYNSDIDEMAKQIKSYF